jgi:hypothetical protein
MSLQAVSWGNHAVDFTQQQISPESCLQDKMVIGRFSQSR